MQSSRDTVLIVSFILELPRDIPIPHDFGIAPFAERTSAWEGWTGEDLRRLAGMPQAFPDHLVPGTRAVFRRASVKTALPLRAADAAFGDWIEPSLSKRERVARRRGLKKATRKGMQASRCVVGLSCFVPSRDAPEELELDNPVEWIRSQFFQALVPLNSYLLGLGLVSNDWRVGPVSTGDLPPLMPVILEEVKAGDEPGQDASHFVVSIRPDSPDHADRPEPAADVAAHAAAIVNSANRGSEPYLDVFGLLRDAWAHDLMGESNRCVIALGTAVETLLSTTLREGGIRVGWTPDRISQALEPWIGLKRRVTQHFSSLLAEAVDVDDSSSAWGRWWKSAYWMRNMAVHEGARITLDEAVEAKAATAALVRQIRDSLAARSELEDLARALRLDLPDEIHDYRWQFVTVLPGTI
jgi:hypothetical protein